MAIEKVLDAENSPDIVNQSTAVEVFPEETRQDQIANAAQILVNEEEVLLDEEMMEPEAPQMDFNANLVEFIDPVTLQKISSDLLSSIKSDKQSRSEWEKTYTDGLKYLGMKFDESRSQPIEGS